MILQLFSCFLLFNVMYFSSAVHIHQTDPQQEALFSAAVLTDSLAAGFLAVMVDDMMNSPTLRPLPHFSSYSLDTGFSFTETSANPAILIMRSSSSTEEAPLTQQECMLGSF